MEMALFLRSPCAVAFVFLLGLLNPCYSIELLFGGNSATLSPSPPESLSATTLSCVLTSFLGAPSAFQVDAHNSEKINQVVSPNFLHRPSTVWAVSFAGLESKDVESFGKSKAFRNEKGWIQTGPIELEDAQPVQVVAAVRAARFSVAKQGEVVDLQGGVTHRCADSCLEVSLLELSGMLGESYDPVDAPLRGVLSSEQKDVQLSLSNPPVSLWAGELVGVWHEARSLSLTEESVPALLETSLLGLQLIRAAYGAESPEFEFAAEFSWKAMGSVLDVLKEHSRECVVEIALLGDVDVIHPNNEFGEVVETYRRRLMQEKEPETKDGRAGYTDAFIVKATAYGITIFIFAFLLSGLYAMTSMDFTSDTLLYSQAKMD